MPGPRKLVHTPSPPCPMKEKSAESKHDRGI